METLKRTIAANMVKLRNQRGLTQKTVAKAIGVSRSHYAKMEAGYIKMQVFVLFCLARYYGVSMDCFCLEQTDFVGHAGILSERIVSLEMRNHQIEVKLRVYERLNHKLEEELYLLGACLGTPKKAE